MAKKKKYNRTKKPTHFPEKEVISPSDNHPIRDLITNNIHWVILGICALFYLIARYNFLDMPLNRDEGAYAYLGKKAIMGGIPYRDFYEIKPPGLFYAYGIVGWIMGFGEVGLRMSVALINLGISGWIYLIANNLFRDKKVSIIGAAFFLLFSLNQGIYGFTAVAEHYVNLFSMGAIYFLTGPLTKKRLIYGGILIALAMTIKQTAILFFGFCLLFLLVRLLSEKANAKTIIQKYLNFGLPVLALGLATLGLMFTVGDWQEFMYWMVDRSTNYAGKEREDWLFYFNFFGGNIIRYQWPLLCFAGVGVILFIINSVKEKNIVHITFFTLLLGVSMVSVFPGMRFYPQYWILLAPVSALITAYGFNCIKHFSSNVYSVYSLLAFALIITAFIVEKDYYLTEDANIIMAETFTGNPYYETREICNYINSIKAPEDELMVLGSEPQAYLYFDKMPQTKHIYHAMITANNNKNIAFQDEALNDLVQTRPKYVIFSFIKFSWNVQAGDIQSLYQNAYSHVNNNYRAIAYVDFLPGRSTYVYGKEARFYTPKSTQYMTVYERR